MTFSLPLSSVTPLSDQERAACRELIEKRFAGGRRSSGPGFVLQSADLVPAYEISLKTLLEIRQDKVEPVLRPCTPDMADLPEAPSAKPPTPGMAPSPQAAPPPLPAKESIHVWDHPSEPRKEFTPHQGVYPIRATLQRRDCADCGQKGKTSCKQCFAKGQASCEACVGEGTQQCHFCKGKAVVHCLKCDGQGKIASGGMTNKTLGLCDACKGSGKFPCNRCNKGRIDCPTCGNTGKRACPACEGQGQRNCPTCQGNGRTVSGYAFRAEFRPTEARSTAALEEAPLPALELALVEKGAPVVVDLPPGATLEKELEFTELPSAFRTALLSLAKQAVPAMAASSRPALQKLLLSEGKVIRAKGTLHGRDAIYWVQPGKDTVYAEKDPLSQMSQSAVEVARKAVETGNWQVAVDQAEQTLSYGGEDLTARGILRDWRRKVLKECLGFAGAAGAVMAGATGLHILFLEPGLHKTGAAALSVGLYLALGIAAGAVTAFFARRLFNKKVRLSACAGAPIGALLLVFGVTRWGLGWNPVKAADDASLARELKAMAKFADAQVYWEPDHKAVMALHDKYKDTQAGLDALNVLLRQQETLKAERDVLSLKFKEELDAIVHSSAFLPDKQKKIRDLKETYAVRGVDVAAADKVAAEMVERAKKAAIPVVRRPRGRISIVPSRSSKTKTPPKKKKPAPTKKKSPRRSWP